MARQIFKVLKVRVFESHLFILQIILFEIFGSNDMILNIKIVLTENSR